MDKRTYLLNVVLFNQSKITEGFIEEDKSGSKESESNESSESSVVYKLIHSLKGFGYVLGEDLFNKVSEMEESKVVELHEKLVKLISMVKGDISGEVFYPNFPHFVKSLNDEDLEHYRNLHYLFRGISMEMVRRGTPEVDVDFVLSRHIEGDVVSKEDEHEEVSKIKDAIESEGYETYLKESDLTVIKLGTEEDAIDYIRNIINTKSSIDEGMLKSIEVILELDESDLEEVLPENIERKEVMAKVVSLLVQREGKVEPFKKYIQTTTDVLRVVDVINGGNGTLTTFNYGKMNRPTRRFVLELLDSLNPYTVSEDMFRNDKVWKGLLKVLHPYEKRSTKYGNARKAFTLFIDGDKSHTFNHKVESLVNEVKEGRKREELVELLSTRPGEFARRIDFLLREVDDVQLSHMVLSEFDKVVGEVSSLILYQMKTHFDNYDKTKRFVETPEGFHFRDKSDKEVSEFNRYILKGIVDKELTRRLSELEELGKVYLDPRLKMIKLPISLRTASVKSSRYLTRGSRIPLDGKENIRLFTHWKNNKDGDRTDIDLSALFVGEDYKIKDRVAYYNQRADSLKSVVHSGDMTNAPRPKGAIEFVQFNKKDLLDNGVRYVIMSVILYHGFGALNFKGINETTAGWVEFDGEDTVKTRHSGRVDFNAEDVKNQFDITSNSASTLPIVFDLKRDEATWIDAYSTDKKSMGNVDRDSKFLIETIKNHAEDKSMTVYDLLDNHIKGRNGVEVFDKDVADEVFTLDELNIPDILSNYL